MVVGVKKYNPGFLTDDEIVASFCVRNAEFQSLLESLRASDGNSNVHSLVIGPRGSGKTHLTVASSRRDTPQCTTVRVLPDRICRGELRDCDGWGILARVPESPGRAGSGRVSVANLRLSYSDLSTIRRRPGSSGALLRNHS